MSPPPATPTEEALRAECERLRAELLRVRSEAAEALRARDASLALVHAMLDSAPVGMGYLDHQLRYLHINPVLAAMNGAPPEAHVGRTVREVLGGQADLVEGVLRHVLDSGTPVLDQHVSAPLPGGNEVRHLLTSYFPVKAGEQTLGVGGVVMDITSQKRVEETLRFLAEATTRLSGSLDLRTTLEGVARLLLERLADSCIVDVLAEDGERLERAVVVAREPETQRLLRETLPVPPPPDSGSPMRQVLRTGQAELVGEVSEAWLEAALPGPVPPERVERLRPHSLMLVPLAAHGRTLGVISVMSQSPARRYTARDLAFLEDLAWRAALAVENARLFQRAEQAVATRDEFVAIATHELRTPLSALHLQLAALRKALERGEPLVPERLHPALDTALRQTDRLEQLLTHLFDVARLSTGQLELEREPVDLTALVHGLVARFEEPLAQVHSTALVLAEQPVVARVDRLRVEQVLMNLLSNAMKYAPGQPLEVTVEPVEGEAVVAVRDFGPGIPAAQQARIFERFQRATDAHARSSLGLGLYISRQLARAHGGELTVRSTPGEGACFQLRLPRT